MKEDTIRRVYIASACIAVNVGLGKVSNMFSLPLTFDTVGTILAASLLPLRFALVVGICTNFVTALIISPIFLAFTGTQVAIALVAALFNNFKFFTSYWKSAVSGFSIGIVSAIVSSPVIAIAFGGVAIPSITAINALFLASGQNLWQAVLSGSLIVESIDKLIAGLIVCGVLTRLPKEIITSLNPKTIPRYTSARSINE